MRIFSFSFLAAALLCSAAHSAPAGAQAALNQVTAISYNIRHGRWPEGVDTLKNIAEFLRAQRADIVFLQELDKGTLRSGGVNQLRILSELSGYAHVRFAKAIDLEGGAYGIGIASRYPFEDYEEIPLEVARTGEWYEARVLQLARIRVGAHILLIGNTHLHVPEAYNLAQAELLTRILRTRLAPGQAVLLGGDFNARPGSATYEHLNSFLSDAAVGFCEHDWRIDYFFTRLLKTAGFAVPKIGHSDHYPITAIFEFPN
ncbi:MAG TPA: endonuclease/exonuclease/phosphatase family protein [Bdellovibrionales bacterium]|nr:endonuclease/exonuclease/phosphatase family protein [Bdellovibrionales bacterium]